CHPARLRLPDEEVHQDAPQLDRILGASHLKALRMRLKPWTEPENCGLRYSYQITARSAAHAKRANFIRKRTMLAPCLLWVMTRKAQVGQAVTRVTRINLGLSR